MVAPKTTIKSEIPFERKTLKTFDLHIPDKLKERFEDLQSQYGPALYNFILGKRSLLDSVTMKKPSPAAGDFSMKCKYLGYSEDTAKLYIVIQCEQDVAKRVRRFFRQEHVVQDLGTDFSLHIVSGGLRKLVQIPEVKAFGTMGEQHTLCGKDMQLRLHQATRRSTLGGAVMVTTRGGCALYGLIAGHSVYEMRKPFEDKTTFTADVSDRDSESDDSSAKGDKEDLGADSEPDFQFDSRENNTFEIVDATGKSNFNTYIGKVCYDSFQGQSAEANCDWALINLERSNWLPNMLGSDVELFASENLSVATIKTAVVLTARGIQSGELTRNMSGLFLAPGGSFVHAMDFTPSSTSSWC